MLHSKFNFSINLNPKDLIFISICSVTFITLIFTILYLRIKRNQIQRISENDLIVGEIRWVLNNVKSKGNSHFFWHNAQIHEPILKGDHIFTGPNSKAIIEIFGSQKSEMQIESMSAISIDPNEGGTEIHIDEGIILGSFNSKMTFYLNGKKTTVEPHEKKTAQIFLKKTKEMTSIKPLNNEVQIQIDNKLIQLKKESQIDISQSNSNNKVNFKEDTNLYSQTNNEAKIEIKELSDEMKNIELVNSQEEVTLSKNSNLNELNLNKIYESISDDQKEIQAKIINISQESLSELNKNEIKNITQLTFPQESPLTRNISTIDVLKEEASNSIEIQPTSVPSLNISNAMILETPQTPKPFIENSPTPIPSPLDEKSKSNISTQTLISNEKKGMQKKEIFVNEKSKMKDEIEEIFLQSPLDHTNFVFNKNEAKIIVLEWKFTNQDLQEFKITVKYQNESKNYFIKSNQNYYPFTPNGEGIVSWYIEGFSNGKLKAKSSISTFIIKKYEDL